MADGDVSWMIDDLRSQVDSRYGSNSDDVELDESIVDVQASFEQIPSSQESKIELEDSAMLDAEKIVRDAEEKGIGYDELCHELGATTVTTKDLVQECKSDDDEFDEFDESIEDDCDEVVLDFDGNASFEYTKPTSLTYKGRRFSCTQWNELYVRLVKELYNEYEHLFEPGMRFLGKRINFGSSIGMRNPKHIKDDLYLECNLDAKSIVKKICWILNHCPVSRDDVVIRYFRSGNRLSGNRQSCSNRYKDIEPATRLSRQTSEEDQAAYEQTVSSQESKKEFADSDVLEVEELVRDAEEKGIDYDELCRELGATIVTTKDLVQKCKRVVEINGRLRHEDSFVDWDDGARRMSQIMENLMQENDGYISRTELYSYARAGMNMFLNDNDMNDERLVFDFARHLFEKNSFANKRYSFVQNLHISKLGNEVQSTFDLVCKYAEAQGGVFREDDLAEYLERKRVGMSKSNIRTTMKMKVEPKFFFCDTGTIIAADSMKIDDSWKGRVKRELTRLLDDADGHIVLRQIDPIWYELLPPLPGNRRWTPLLIQSILRFYGEELGAKTIAAKESQRLDTLHAMLVKNDGSIQNFGDAIIANLIDDGVEQREFEAEELRKYLIEKEMIQGGELIGAMQEVLSGDERFAWDAFGKNVTVKLERTGK